MLSFDIPLFRCAPVLVERGPRLAIGVHHIVRP
jgi:hypothetical protein